MLYNILACILIVVLFSLIIKLMKGNGLTFEEKALLQMKQCLEKYGASKNILSNSCIIGLYALVKKSVTKGNDKNPLTFKQKGAIFAGCDQIASFACRIAREEKVPDAAYLMGITHVLLLNNAVSLSDDYINYIKERLDWYGMT